MALAILMCSACLSSGKEKNDVFNLVMSRIQNENENSIRGNLDNAVHSSLELFSDGGFFSDVDYENTGGYGMWRAFTHLTRLYEFVFAYTSPESAYYEDEDLYEKIVIGLENWAPERDYENWWYNQIADPQRLGVLLIQMRKAKRQLPPLLERKLIGRMERNSGEPGEWTGANKTDMALHWLYRACLLRDTTLLEQAVNFAYEPVALTSGEGIQHDYSFFQHGPQLYIWGYGNEFIKGVTLFAQYLIRTPYALSDDKLKIFGAFVRETFLPVIRGQYALFTVGGRGGMSRPRATAANVIFAEKMKFIDPENARVYDAAVQRIKGDKPASYGIESRHIHYPIAEYTLHTRPEYVIDVRIASKRTARIEYGNMENLKAYYASDGSTNIVRRGDEYADIFPVWNWTRVPGVTCAQTDFIPLPPRQWQVMGTADFSGGVSNSVYGVTAYSYDSEYTGNSAQKSWFFFDREIVCLGSGISADDSAARFDINTSLNQCLLAGDVTVSVGEKISVLSGGVHNFPEAPDWVLHDGVAYFFPRGGTAGLDNMAQSGSWKAINAARSGEELTKNVFSLYLNHGKNPQNARYAYIVVPGIANAAGAEEYRENACDNAGILIAENNETVQAVWHTKLDILGIVFYDAGIFEYGGISVETDRACTILLTDISGPGAVLYIADPAKTETAITVITRIPGISAEPMQTVCDFRTSGIYAGATKMYRLQK